MRNRFDHLAKEIGQEALGRSGATAVHDEISPETQHADLRHEPVGHLQLLSARRPMADSLARATLPA